MIPTKTVVKLTTVYHFQDGTENEHYAGKLFFPHGIESKALESILETLAESCPYNDGQLRADIKTTLENW